MKSLAAALSSQSFSVTAELPVWGNMPAGEILRQAQQLAPYVDGIQFATHPQHRAVMSHIALAALLMREGIDPVTRLNCRDRNRQALRSDLIGLRALGVTSLLLSRGSLFEDQAAMEGTPVFDLNCRELISLAAEVSDQQASGPGQEFMIGTSVTALRPNAGWKGDSCSTRSSAGARFLQTQPCLSIPMLRSFMQRLVELRFTWKFAVIVTLAPLPGMKAASWQIEQARGTVIPKTVLNQLAEASDPEQPGILLCAQQIREIASIPGVSGVNLLTLGNPTAVIAAIETSGVRERKHVSVAG